MSKIEVNEVVKQSGSTLTIGGSGTTVQLGTGASQTGFGRTGTVDWCTTAKTSPFTAVSGDGFFVNTTSGQITVTLPASPSQGDIVAFKDYAKTWDCNAVTVCRNGSKIAGSCLNATLSVEAQSVTLIYVDNTQGWIDIQDSTASIAGAPNYVAATGGNTTITCGDFKTHIFTGDGTLCVSSAGSPSGSNSVDYLVVAGGGGAGGFYFSGGGGAGGFRMSNVNSIPAPTTSPLASPTGLSLGTGAVPVTVGGGGPGGQSGPNPGANLQGVSGNVSTISTITSAGGGGGGHETIPSLSGGSGGGSAGYSIPSNSCGAGGAGNTPPVSPPQGNNGGSSSGSPVPTNNAYAAGGGGAGAAGATGRPGDGNGGDGSFIGDPFVGPTAPAYGTSGPVSSVRYFAGGGGGGGGPGVPNCGQAPGTKMDGGAGGGGAGKGPAAPGTSSNPGTTNTGGGGGGSGNNAPQSSGRAGGNGGPGIVMIRYKFQN